MKKISSFILVIAMIISMAFVMNLSPITAHAAETSVWDGTTITQPTSMKTIDGVYYYEISTAEELAYIAKTGGDWLGYNYILANDITLNSVDLTYDANGNLTVNASTLNQWTPINGFKGIFNGNGHTISGVYVNTTSFAGFFTSFSGDLYDLTLKNSYIKGKTTVGGISSNSSKIGAKFSGCKYYGAVVGESTVGGIVGYIHCVYLSNCTNYGDVWGNGSHVAGIVGHFDAYGIDNCFNEGNIYSTGDYVAGIAGSSRTYGISGCKNSGNITGNNYVGGICGKIEDGGLSSCGNTGNISGTQYVGGICGYSAYYYVESWMGSISNGYNTGNVEGESYVGGVTGYVNYANVSNCLNTGNVTGSSTTGAIVGHSESIWGKGSVSGCYYLKTAIINSNLLALGNTTEDTDGATSKDDSFFCVKSDKTLNKNGHTYSSTVPCDATCDNCGYERTVTHTYDNIKYDSDKHWYECDCGEVKPDSEESHTGGTATCTRKAKCDVCKQAYGDLNANNHTAATSWTSANNQHYHVCTNGCDAKLDVANCADSDKDHKCDVCSAAMGTHEAARGKHTCEYCNQTVTECADSDKDHKCDVCGKVLSTVSGTDNENESSGDKVSEPDNDKPQTGCGSVIAGTSVGAIVLISIGAFVVMKKRKTK